MSTHQSPLDPILKPRSIAVIGASRQENTIGNQIVRNLTRFGFTGSVHPINRKATSVCSIAAVPTVLDLDAAPDMAVIAVPKEAVQNVARDCATRGVRGLVVISAGFREIGEAGGRLERELIEIVRSNGMRMVGPNCMGVLNTDPAISMNATFADLMPPHGAFAFMSQSGALGLSVLDYAQEYGIGISQFVSVGNKPDVSGNDLLLQWETDPAVKVILMYVENFGNPTKFLEIASRVTRTKPIVALKSGRSQIGAQAAASHTGALAASDRAIDALLTQAGVLRASSMEELFDMAIAFGSKALPRSHRTAILTNSGGPGILAADALSAYDLEMPALSAATVETLRRVLPAEASLRNPLDMIASAQPAAYRIALEALLADPQVDAALAIFVPPMGVSQQDVAEAVVAAARTSDVKPVTAVLMGRNGLPQGRAELREAGIPAYIFPESAARGMSALNRYREWTARPEPPPYALEPVPAAAAQLIENAKRDGRTALTQSECLDLLVHYGIRTAFTIAAGSACAAIQAAGKIGYPVVLKLASPDITHKTEAHGVRINLENHAAVESAWDDIMKSGGLAFPEARLDGVIVQKMHTGGVETIVGASRDPAFGALVMFGLGGVFVEAIKDVAFRVAPVSEADASDMMNAIQAHCMLDGFRTTPRADRVSINRAIRAISRIMLSHPEIQELDINPLLAGPAEAVALDARISLRAESGHGASDSTLPTGNPLQDYR
jgi:acetyltransferase